MANEDEMIVSGAVVAFFGILLIISPPGSVKFTAHISTCQVSAHF